MKSSYRANTFSIAILLAGLSAATALSGPAGLPVVPKHESASLKATAQVQARDVAGDVWHARRQAGYEDLLPPDFPPRCATQCAPYALSMQGCGSASATSQKARLGCECNNAFFETWVNCALCYPHTYDSSPGGIGEVVSNAQQRCIDTGLPVVVDMSRIPGAVVSSDAPKDTMTSTSTTRGRPRPTPKIVEIDEEDDEEEDEEDEDDGLAADGMITHDLEPETDDMPRTTRKAAVLKGTVESSPTGFSKAGSDEKETAELDEEPSSGMKVEVLGMLGITITAMLAVAMAIGI